MGMAVPRQDRKIIPILLQVNENILWIVEGYIGIA